MTDCKNCKYTDEYCASGDCNKTQANDLACNKISLTEQWKKGELPSGYYYVKDGENMIAEYLDGYFYNDGNPMTSFSGGVDEVLAPVPSYDEWEQLLNWADFTDDYHELREKLEIAEYEKAELKELLKECREVIKNVDTYYGNYDSINGYLVINKIDEVLK